MDENERAQIKADIARLALPVLVERRGGDGRRVRPGEPPMKEVSLSK